MPQLQNIHMPEQKILRKPTLSDSVPCALLFLASRCSLMGISPFATAMFASSFDLRIGLLGIGAAILGLASSGVAVDGIKYISAMLLFWLYTALKADYKEKTILSATVCAGFLMLCGIITLAYTGADLYSLILLTAESIVCAFFYVIFEKASMLLTYSRKSPTEQELISGAVCTGIFISGLAGITLVPGLELSTIMSAYAIMAIAMHMPLAVAGSCGVAAGLICSMNSVHAVTLMGMYGISAMFANMLRSFGKYGVALGFVGGAAVITLFVGNSISISAIEIVAASIFFIITPNRFHKSIGIFISRAAGASEVCPETKIREYLAHRLSGASHAFSKLAGVYRGATQKRLNLYNRDICTVLDNTINRVCKTCPYNGGCIHSETTNTYRIMFSLLEIIERNGFCNTVNAPGEFMALCKKQELFLSELAHSYELFKRDSIKQGEFINNRDLLLKQYEEIAEMLAQFHDEISSGFRLLPDMEEKISAELKKSGISPRDIRVFENGAGETEVFIGFNGGADRNAVAEKISIAVGMDMEYRNNISGGLMRFCPCARFDIEFGMMQLAKENQIVSGDSITNFRYGNDKYYVIVCDGMGSGSDAGKESRITIRLLEELLRDGFSAKTAIEMVNSSLAMGIEKEFFSSVDLLCVNLMTGAAEFYKIGSCKSFIKHGNSIDTVFAPSLPAGILPEVHISCISKRLEPEDIIIMMTDGAEGNCFGYLSGERVKKVIDSDDNSMDDLAAAIINASKIKGIKKVRDDITVAAIKITDNM